mmetsp:Transcript_10307/g.30394  ORF Transcript_10307/g.30394 Transcript_10307/m.30394 type:complete len:109 (+) Transcript_10307:979-1305(+)
MYDGGSAASGGRDGIDLSLHAVHSFEPAGGSFAIFALGRIIIEFAAFHVTAYLFLAVSINDYSIWELWPASPWAKYARRSLLVGSQNTVWTYGEDKQNQKWRCRVHFV